MIISWQDASSEIKEDWLRLQKEIRYSSDKLKENYIGLEPESFLYFNLIVSETSEIKAFAGVAQKDIWQGFNRICTRLFIRPKFRKMESQGSALDQYTNITSYTTALIDYQLNKFKEKDLFISRECTFRSFAKFLRTFDLNRRMTLLDGFYKVCGLESTNPKCVQKICVSNNSFPHINRLDYLKYE